VPASPDRGISLPLRAFTGPFTTVNGVIWPYHKVEPRWYRSMAAPPPDTSGT
jgi:FtsP/CotA-like multicopper oxidase with cupredoxin domain